MSQSQDPLLSNENYVLDRAQRLSNISAKPNQQIIHPDTPNHIQQSKQKVIFVIILFILSLISFVTQTEFTSMVYEQGFSEPFLLLYLTHSSWWIMWWIQVLAIANYKVVTRYIKVKSTNNRYCWKGYNHYFMKSFRKQHENIFTTLEIIADINIPGYKHSISTPNTVLGFVTCEPMIYMCKACLALMVILSVAGSSWYFAMNLSYASDVTAIYNCSAFAAYAFAIPLLGEKFSLVKGTSVLVAVLGVFIVAYSGDDNSDSDSDKYPHRFMGNLIIFGGAILYGLYEVLYKKFACAPSNIVSSRKQASFSNFTASIIGIFSFLVLGFVMAFVHITGIHKFDISIPLETWMLIFCSIVSNIIFSISFLSLMALTSPVLSSVASLITIFLIGLVEWSLFNIKLSKYQLAGDLIIVLGFGVLTYASWNEISEDEIDQDVDDDSMFSIRSGRSIASRNSLRV